MLVAAIRRQCKPNKIFRRHASSKSDVDSAARPGYRLHPDKMRALISLYHQSHTFINFENLSQRIDAAFTNDRIADVIPDVTTLADLREIRRQQRSYPRISEWETETTGGMLYGSGWSEKLSRREARVIEALYGVDFGDSQGRMPGLEALQEHRKQIRLTADEPQSEPARWVGSVDDAYEEK